MGFLKDPKVFSQDSLRNTNCLPHNSHRVPSVLTTIPLRIARTFPQTIHKNPRISVRFLMYFKTIGSLFPNYFYNIHSVFQQNSHRTLTVLPLKVQVSHRNPRIPIWSFPLEFQNPNWNTKIPTGNTEFTLDFQNPHYNLRIHTVIQGSILDSRNLHWNAGTQD